MLMRCHYWIFNTRNIRETMDSFGRGSYYHLFKRYLFILLKKMRTETKTRGALGFSVFWFQLFFRSVFWFLCQKIRFFGFGVHCSLRIFRFSASGFRFSRKIPAGFRIWYPMQFSDLISDAVFNFSYLTYLGSSFSSIWAAITRLHWSRIAAKRKSYREKCVTNQLKYRRDS